MGEYAAGDGVIVDGLIGSAASLVANASVAVTDSGAITAGGLNPADGDFTVMAWVQIGADTAGGVFSKGSSLESGFELVYSFGSLSFLMWNADGDQANLDVPGFLIEPDLSVGWHHYVATVEREADTDIFRLYLDGEFLSSTSTDAIATDALVAGSSLEAAPDLEAQVDELRLMSGVLSQNEIAVIYANTSAPLLFAEFAP